VAPLLDDFTRALSLPPAAQGRPVTGFFPGSTIGNFTPLEAEAFLAGAHRLLGPGRPGRVLVCDPASMLTLVLTRETGGTDIGARLRAILHDTTNAHLDDRAEALLAAADRAQHLAEVVRPALDAGRTVVSDRSVYSSLAYQGYGRGLDVTDIAKLNEWATAGRWPDRVIFLDTPDDVVAERMSRRDLDRFESEDEAFHQRVLDGYRTMAAADPDRWITVQAIGSIDRVAAQIRAALAEHGVVIDQ